MSGPAPKEIREFFAELHLSLDKRFEEQRRFFLEASGQRPPGASPHLQQLLREAEVGRAGQRPADPSAIYLEDCAFADNVLRDVELGREEDQCRKDLLEKDHEARIDEAQKGKVALSERIDAARKGNVLDQQERTNELHLPHSVSEVDAREKSHPFPEDSGSDSETDGPAGNQPTPLTPHTLIQEASKRISVDDAPSKRTLHTNKFSMPSMLTLIDVFGGFLVTVNAVTIAYTADQAARYPKREESSEQLGIERFFCWCFLVELIFRMAISGGFWAFVAGKDQVWNLFDTGIVTIAMVEEALRLLGSASAFGGNMTSLRVLKALKLLRVFRIARVLRFCHELRTMVLCVLNTLRALFWAGFLLVIVVFLFGVYFAQTVGQLLQADDNTDLAQLFGGLDRTMFSLFKAATGGLDWSDFTDPIEKQGDGLAVFVFVVYFALVVFAMMNVFTGIFVEQATKASEEDLQRVIHEQRVNRQRATARLRELFESADESCDGTLTWKEMQHHLRIDWVQAHLQTLGLEPWDISTFFELLDVTGQGGEGGKVQINTFVNALLRMKGPAKTMDLLAMRVELDTIGCKVKELFYETKQESKKAKARRREEGRGREGA